MDKLVVNFASVEEIVEDAKLGKLFIIVDSESRENEGDFVVLGDRANLEAISFMINYGSGIVCLALEQVRAQKLGLGLMSRSNVSSDYTAFTTSVDARYGIATGVSAEDRLKTIMAIVDHNATSDDLVTPGHMFPLIANPGGVLKRPGHTEASLEIAKLAGLSATAVICEVMNRDGTMSRLCDLVDFTVNYGIKIVSVDMIVSYLRSHLGG